MKAAKTRRLRVRVFIPYEAFDSLIRTNFCVAFLPQRLEAVIQNGWHVPVTVAEHPRTMRAIAQVQTVQYQLVPKRIAVVYRLVEDLNPGKKRIWATGVRLRRPQYA
jgi:hypothetical protein